MAEADWNYRVPETMGDICKVLRRRIDIHQQWADYISDNPADPAVKQALASGIGAADNHLLYIRQYEAAIALIAGDLGAASGKSGDIINGL